MRWLRLLGILFLFDNRFLFGAFYSPRLPANTRGTRKRLGYASRSRANTPRIRIFFQRGVNFTAEFPAFYGNDAAVRLTQLPAKEFNSLRWCLTAFASTTAPKVRGGKLAPGGDAGLTQLARTAHFARHECAPQAAVWMRGGHPADINSPAPRKTPKWCAITFPSGALCATLPPSTPTRLRIGVGTRKNVLNESAGGNLRPRPRNLSRDDSPMPPTSACIRIPQISGTRSTTSASTNISVARRPLHRCSRQKISARRVALQKPVAIQRSRFPSVVKRTVCSVGRHLSPRRLENPSQKATDALLSGPSMTNPGSPVLLVEKSAPTVTGAVPPTPRTPP